MTDCVFCKIIAGDIPTDKVFENDKVIAFKDMSPKAPIHYLFVPKDHYESTNDLAEDASIVTDIFEAIVEVAQRDGFADSGYRVVNNVGRDGLQTVPHLHFHVLAGRELKILDTD